MCLPSRHCSASIRTATLEARYRTLSVHRHFPWLRPKTRIYRFALPQQYAVPGIDTTGSDDEPNYRLRDWRLSGLLSCREAGYCLNLLMVHTARMFRQSPTDVPPEN